MSTYADRRDSRRILVGPEFFISFQLKGRSYQEVRISNLSAGGCFALVGVRDARLFERGAGLENLVFLHPELPKSPIQASVAYVLGGRPGPDPLEMAGIGIEFTSIEESARRSLEVWVEAASAAQQR